MQTVLLGPRLRPGKLSLKEKLEFVRESDGLLINISGKNEFVDGDMEFYGCKLLRYLPDGLEVAGALDLQDCALPLRLPKSWAYLCH